jgi:dihydrofolate reductase
MGTMKAIVVAYGKNHEIGADNDMPWHNSLKDDLKHFRELTTGSTVIVGRKTFDSFGGRPLPDRENIVVTRSNEEIDGVKVARSLAEAYKLASSRNIYVIGGGQIYSEAIKDMDILYATEVNAEFDNGTVFFPEIDSTIWREVARVHQPADERNRYSFDLVKYERYENQRS